MPETRQDARGRTLRKVEYAVGGGGPTGDVTRERAIYELPEQALTPVVLSSVGPLVRHDHPLPSDFVTLGAVVNEDAALVSLAEEKVKATASDLTVQPTPVERTSGIVAVKAEQFATPTDGNQVYLAWYPGANQVISSTASVTNPSNALGRDTNTAATVAVSSSGLTQNQNNNATWTMDLAFSDIVAPDKYRVAFQVIDLYWALRNTGQANNSASGFVYIDLSLDNGSTWTNIATRSTFFNSQFVATGSPIVGLAVGDPMSRVNGLRVRWRGSINSGTGLVLPSTTTASLYAVRPYISGTTDE